MKLIECESRNGGSKLIQVLPFSIENYEMLKSSDNLVFLVKDDKEIIRTIKNLINMLKDVN